MKLYKSSTVNEYLMQYLQEMAHGHNIEVLLGLYVYFGPHSGAAKTQGMSKTNSRCRTMEWIEKEVIVRQPNYRLEVVKSVDEHDAPHHAFVMCITAPDGELIDTVTLLTGEGHTASRKDIHCALYLFQRFHMENPQKSAVIH